MGPDHTASPDDVRSAAPVAVLAGVAVICWMVAVRRMHGMDMGPGTDLGSLPFFAGIWITMMAAMMLPALASLERSGRARRSAGGTAGELLSSLQFAASYLAVWALFGVAAFLLYRTLQAAHPRALSWSEAGPYLAGAVVAAAGLYELTPQKRAALRRCRDGQAGVKSAAPHAGLRHGLDCLASSIGLMLVILVLGPMSVVWMAFVAVIVLLERVPAFGPRLTPAAALLLVALGLGVALAPGAVPGLTLPG